MQYDDITIIGSYNVFAVFYHAPLSDIQSFNNVSLSVPICRVISFCRVIESVS